MAKKFWGQHFLKDRPMIEKIVASLQISAENTVLEIGPGQGALTGEIIGRIKKLIAVEIDRDLCSYLQKKLADRKNIEIVAQDFLKLDLEDLQKREEKMSRLKILGNLPYYLTSAILRKLCTEIFWEQAVLTIQKEVAERVVASPGTKKYGILSVAVQNKCATEYLFTIPRNCFFPIPQVDSAVIRITPHAKPQVPPNWEKDFFQVVHAAFNQRRKNIANSLAHGLNLDKDQIFNILAKCEISPLQRAENLSLNDFLKIAKCTKNTTG